MYNTLIDNTTDFKLFKYIQQLIGNEQCNHIRIATGYWDLPGMVLIFNELKSFFERGGKLDLMIGQEPMLRAYQMRTDIPKEEIFPDFYIKRDINQLTDKYQPVVQLLLDYSNADNEESSQIKIRVFGQGEHKQFLHAKCYIFLGASFAHGVVGSSNFTEKGLQDNAELNYLETNPLVVTGITDSGNFKSHNVWFDEMRE